PNMTGRASIPVQTNIRNSPRIVDGEEITPPRFTTCNSGLIADTSIAHVVQGWVPKDATKGRVLEAINLREDIATSDNLVKYEWLAKGLIHPDLKLRMTVGQNPFVGISIGICCDYFGRLSKYYEGDTALPIEVCNQLPNFVCPISEKSVFEFDLDMSLAGYNLFQTSKGFADPVLLVYIIDTNSLPASDEWVYTCEVCIKSALHATSVANKPILSLPHFFDGRLPLDLWRGPFSFELGRSSKRENHIGINFGSARVVSGTNTFYSFPAAYTQLLQSVGGILHGTVVQTGSKAISCEMFLILQPDKTAHNLEQALRLPGCRIPTGGGPFSIRIQTPFQREQIFNTGVQLVIYAVGGPMGAQAISAPYQYMVHFSHIQEEGDPPPRPIGNVLLFNWATISEMTNLTRFQIPARLSDLVLPGQTVTMRRNALANLIRSCGFFRGRVTFVFQWTLNVAHIVPTATMQILTAVGRVGNAETNGSQILQSWIVPVSQVFEKEVEMDLTDYPGFNTSGGIGADHDQPYIDIACGNFPQIFYMNINVRVHPGFELYGRSITPLRI
ncbi:polyprotein, partial [Blueberry leaf mottle virus]